MSDRTAVYRLFDDEGALLYVGIADHIGRRWDQHAVAQPWWPQVQRQTVTWFPSRGDAADAEIQAIRSEHPVHNVRHNEHPAVEAETGLPEITTWTDAQVSVSEARANLPEVVRGVRFLRKQVLLTRWGKPQAVIVPAEFAAEIERAGGTDELLAQLRESSA